MPVEPSYSIELASDQDDMSIDESRLRQAVQHVLTSEGVARAEISLAVVDSATMQDLNRQYLQHDYDTDVLSFLLEAEPAEPIDPQRPGTGRVLDGEVVVSAGMACRQAPRFDWTAEDELLLYTVHGVLHLVGYDDRTPDDRQMMRDRERFLLAELGLRVTYREDHAADERPAETDDRSETVS